MASRADSPARSVPSRALGVTDLDQIATDYSENAVHADLTYEGKFLIVSGTVLAIGNGVYYKGMVGRVQFTSNGLNQNTWSCDFDISQTDEISRLHRGDSIFLKGQFFNFLIFRHCSVVPQSSISFAPETKPPTVQNSPPLLISKVEPEYSLEARKAKIEGSVLLRFIVDLNGRARDIRVIRGLGFGLDENAMRAVSEWRFRPAIKDGVPVEYTAMAEVSFRFL